MSKHILSVLFIIIFCLNLSQGETFYHKDHLFNTGIGARPLAMGRSFTAVDNDVNSMLFNPAGTATIKNFQIMGLRSQRLIDINQYTFLGSYSLAENGVIGLGYIEMSLNDLLLADPNLDSEGYTQVAGKANYSEKVYILNYSKKLSEQHALGINYKYYSNNLENDRNDLFDNYYATGADFDLGYLFYMSPEVTLGASYHNIGGKIKWNTDTNEIIEGYFKCGAAFKTTLFNKNTLLSLDSEVFQNEPSLSHAGLELEFLEGVSIRYGINQRVWKDTTKFSNIIGAGLNLLGFNFDYTYYPDYGEDIDPKHFFSITYQFTPPEPTVYKPKAKLKTTDQEAPEGYEDQSKDIEFIYMRRN